MLGTIVNTGAVIAGSLLGLGGLRWVPEETRRTLTGAMGLTVTVIGAGMALKSTDILIALSSLVAGGVIGESLRIERRLEGLAGRLGSRFSAGRGEFARGFMTATLIYCTGSMAVVGAIQDGLQGRHDILYTKAILDGVTSMMLSSTHGIGVAFSAIPVLLYQGSIALLASLAQRFLTDAAVAQLSGTGGILLMGIGLNMLGATTVAVGNLLPAIPLAAIIALVRAAL
ncbi:MAG: DUF554 domain-containing protein [Ignavibacteriales bacterium]